MRRNKENSWADGNVLDRGAKESLVPPNELGHESHVWVGDLSSFPDVFEAFIQSYLLVEDHVAKDHGCGS